MAEKVAPTIRYAAAGDAALLAELGARTFAETFAADNTPEDMEAYLASAFGVTQQAAELSDPRATFLLAEIEGTPVGYAKLYAGNAPSCVTGERPVELARLYAGQGWIGRGVGASLMTACVADAVRRGHRTLWLGVWEHNLRAQAFYHRWSFRVVGQQIFQLASDAQTDLVMECALP